MPFGGVEKLAFDVARNAWKLALSAGDQAVRDCWSGWRSDNKQLNMALKRGWHHGNLAEFWSEDFSVCSNSKSGFDPYWVILCSVSILIKVHNIRPWWTILRTDPNVQIRSPVFSKSTSSDGQNADLWHLVDKEPTGVENCCSGFGD